MCRVLDVSVSGFYHWQSRPESKRAQFNKQLLVHIRAINQSTKQTYGAIRMTHQLKTLGCFCGKNKIARLMAQEGIKSVHRKKYRLHTTMSKHLLPIAENMVEQNFNAKAPNQIWASDISYIPTREGFVYLLFLIFIRAKSLATAYRKQWKPSFVLMP